MANTTHGAGGARRRRSLIGSSAMIGVGVIVAGFAFAPTASAVEPVDFASTVTVDGIMTHLKAFQAIADANGGTRAAGTEGNELSGEYVESVLKEAGYVTTRQVTPTQTFDEYSLTTTPAVEGIPMAFSPSTPEDVNDVTGELIQPTDALGCDAAAWAGLDATGKIALVSLGACSSSEKSAAAGAAGASAILIYNNVAAEPLYGTLDAPDDSHIPTIGLTLEEGQSLIAALPTTATLAVVVDDMGPLTFNIIAETAGGDHNNVVMLGAHLDSVTDGPGINDNGSGSATLLETAVQLAKAGETTNAVRFAWWGAEEIGLLGSAAYVDSLTQEETEKIATYMNFDMVASPNYIISVLDANESTYKARVAVPAGSIATEKAFTDYFDSIDQPWVDASFNGRSDYDSFVSVGIPASGLFTGADDVKTEKEVALFGGTAGITHDPNYHSAGDDIDNINQEALGITSKATAFVTASLAEDTSAIDAEKNPSTATPTPTPTPTAEPTVSPTAEPTVAPTAEPAPSTTTAAGGGHASAVTSDSTLAATGAEAGLPLGIGGLLIAGGIGGILLAMARRRSSAGAR